MIPFGLIIVGIVIISVLAWAVFPTVKRFLLWVMGADQETDSEYVARIIRSEPLVRDDGAIIDWRERRS